ncbi:glutaminase domain-containing protein [Tunturiibacter lichenicola]|uniref:glutaminase family protein n=1 Tax=Tunturiibacter lichenicola TaxID=2051959 RepID=UPI003D9B235C
MKFRFFALFTFFTTLLPAQQQTLRPPATPLITHNPYFSIWSNTDKLTDSDTVHWTGKPQPITGLLRVDGHTIRFMGERPRQLPAMQQTAHTITPTHTRYSFTSGGVQLDLTFFTPTILSDLEVLSRTVTYISFTTKSIDGKPHHDVSILLDVDPIIAVNAAGEAVTYSRNQTETQTVLSVGSRDQHILNRAGDDLRIDWGYFHLSVPNDEESASAIVRDTSASADGAFVSTGLLPKADDMDASPIVGRGDAHLATELILHTVADQPVTRHLLVSYTEGFAIQYLQRNLRPWWQRNGLSVAAMLDTAEREMPALERRGNELDTNLTADLTRVGGASYADLCILAYRQAWAAHGFVADLDGQPLVFGKENFSNGSIATVDVLYPASPFFLLFNPVLLEAELRPLLEYTALPNRWRFPFAPHDLGTYPLANGQTYGGGEATEEDQMPVEESGNMLLMIDAVARSEGKTDLAAQFWPKLTQWANFLKEHGLDPENQLTTDDFAGHVTHNANLALKAIDALEAYADLARLLGKNDVARGFSKTAHEYALKWIDLDKEGDHYKIAYDSANTWSQKYNLVWDQLLGYNLFPPSVRESEIAFYKTKLNKYGLPLDSRADYTKLDWSIWTATLASNPADFNAIMDPIALWVNETPTRVPLTDWYDTKNGKQIGFQARSVVGGVFIKALSDKELASKWRAQAQLTGR